MSVINQLDIEDINETLQKFAILIGFTDEGAHTCLFAKGKLNQVDMLYGFSKGIQNLLERMDTSKQDGGVQ